MAATYFPIATTTLTSAVSSYSFSSITNVYTDLELVVAGTDSAFGALALQVNGDAGNHYSWTIMYGNGSAVGSTNGGTNASQLNLGLSDTTQFVSTFKFFSYANTTTYKTILGRGNTASNQVRAGAGIWRGSTGSATQAITSITVLATSLQIGTSLTLYGIKAA
jgi:hypothetical protein